LKLSRGGWEQLIGGRTKTKGIPPVDGVYTSDKRWTAMGNKGQHIGYRKASKGWRKECSKNNSGWRQLCYSDIAADLEANGGNGGVVFDFLHVELHFPAHEKTKNNAKSL